MSKKSSSSLTMMQHTIAGSGAGFVEATIMHPIDTLKTRCQASSPPQGILVIAKNLTQEGGFKAFYKGILSACAYLRYALISIPLLSYVGYIPVCSVITPKVALQFSGLAFFKNKLADKDYIPRPIIPVIAGIFTGIAQVYP